MDKKVIVYKDTKNTIELYHGKYLSNSFNSSFDTQDGSFEYYPTLLIVDEFGNVNNVGIDFVKFV